jgi:hypothetical protein
MSELKFNYKHSKLTEVDGGSARLGATRERNSRNAAALVEGDKLVEVVEIGEHLREN